MTKEKGLLPQLNYPFLIPFSTAWLIPVLPDLGSAVGFHKVASF